MSQIKPKRTHLETAAGRYLDFLDPQPEDISLDDISLALSNTCRWGGQCPHFYSVAEHACLVHDIVVAWQRENGWDPNPRWRLAALHHDAHEAYVGDIPTPLKNMLGEGYRVLVDALDAVIGPCVGLPQPHVFFHDAVVKEADALALFVEAERFKVSKGLTWEGRPAVVALPEGVEWACGLSPADARRAYLERHAALSVRP